ncbi:MAG: alpha-1,4-glucan--maltose-1-phosphate maltosyltransferase, partial [Corynebacterium casei]|nr:alpha-1,4-glucan--maltose-1-phosphate maltosyltransferase [Corynebacterium casei]
LDPRNAQEATVTIDYNAIGRKPGESYAVHDQISGNTYEWSERNFVRLEPLRDVAHIFVLPTAPRERREALAYRHVTDYRA